MRASRNENIQTDPQSFDLKRDIGEFQAVGQVEEIITCRYTYWHKVKRREGSVKKMSLNDLEMAPLRNLFIFGDSRLVLSQSIGSPEIYLPKYDESFNCKNLWMTHFPTIKDRYLYQSL